MAGNAGTRRGVNVLSTRRAGTANTIGQRFFFLKNRSSGGHSLVTLACTLDMQVLRSTAGGQRQTCCVFAEIC
jgi:hypothetical protein